MFPDLSTRRVDYANLCRAGLRLVLPNLFFVSGGAMSRFVVLSFAFMGWAFYELSGGAGFEPRGTRSVLVSPEAAETTGTVPAVAPVEAATLVAKPVLKPRPEPARTLIAPAPAVVESQPEPTAEDRAAVLAQASAGLSGALNIFAAERQGFTLASLEEGAASLTRVAPEPAGAAPESVAGTTAPEAAPDIREVIGSRVNLRDGPGTIYGVIGRLNIGHKVEILGESGDGWLRLRVLPERQTGWISASLISKKTD